jgi:hypothetical protein
MAAAPRLAIEIRDSEAGVQAVALPDSIGELLIELLHPRTLLIGLPGLDLELARADLDAHAMFDGERGVLDVVLRRGVTLPPWERRALLGLLRAVWAPVHVLLHYENVSPGAQIVVRDSEGMFARTYQYLAADLAAELRGPSAIPEWKSGANNEKWVDTRSGVLLEEAHRRMVVWGPPEGVDMSRFREAWDGWRIDETATLEEGLALRRSGGLQADSVAAMLDACQGGLHARPFHEQVARRLQESGFGDAAPGRSWLPPDDDKELAWSALQFAFRAARAGDPYEKGTA